MFWKAQLKAPLSKPPVSEDLSLSGPSTNSWNRKSIRRSLRLSVWDGSAFAAMLGLTQNYITPLALALRATTAQVGLLASFPSFATAISQLAAPNLTERAGSRKAFILPVVFIHAFLWLPVALIPFVFQTQQVWWLIALVTLSGIFGALANPAWGSMMADLVPPPLRGRYFGRRARIASLIALVFSFLAGAILEVLSGNVLIGFAVLFAGAAVCRLLSLYFLTGMVEPPASGKAADSAPFWQMMGHIGSTNLGRFTLFVSLINFGTNVASPFFAVYMLRDLGFSYTAYIINVAFFSIAVMVVQTFWGRRADWAGNLKVISVTSVLIPLVPIVWLVSSNVVYLVAAQIFSGIAWGGFNLASVNFVYDASEPRNRTRQIAFYNAMTGLALCIGALVGGYLIPYLPPIKGYQLLTLFLVSGLIRAGVVVFLLRFILEVRRVPRVKTFELLFGHAALEAGQSCERHSILPIPFRSNGRQNGNKTCPPLK